MLRSIKIPIPSSIFRACGSVRGVRVHAGADEADLELHRLRRRRRGEQPHPEPEPMRIYIDPARAVHKPSVHADLSRSFAIISLAGTQYKVTEGDILVVPRLKDANVGEEYPVSEVLLVGSAEKTLVGRPIVPNVSVRATCEEHTRGDKVIVFKKKRRKGYKRKHGFRQHLSVLRIDQIDVNWDDFDWPSSTEELPTPNPKLVEEAPRHRAGKGTISPSAAVASISERN